MELSEKRNRQRAGQLIKREAHMQLSTRSMYSTMVYVSAYLIPRQAAPPPHPHACLIYAQIYQYPCNATPAFASPRPHQKPLSVCRLSSTQCERVSLNLILRVEISSVSKRSFNSNLGAYLPSVVSPVLLEATNLVTAQNTVFLVSHHLVALPTHQFVTSSHRQNV